LQCDQNAHAFHGIHRSLHPHPRGQRRRGPTGCEIKQHGYRLQVRRDGDAVALFTRRGYDWSKRYPAIAVTEMKLCARSFTLDGEACVCGPDGVPIFDALHRRGTVREAMLYAFDLLELDGEDLRRLPLADRKKRLARLLGGRRLGIVLGDHTDEDGATIFRQACRMGLDRGHRLEATDSALQFGPVARLAQGEKPGQPRNGAGAGGGVVKPKTMLIDNPEPSIRQAIARPLVAFNNSRASQPEDYRPLVMVLTDGDGGDILGGLWADTNFAHMHVDLLFVPETLRGLGLGRQMLLQAEQEAVVRGCRGAWLDTYNFQARGFYERLGYVVFGTLDDYPPGQSRIFLRKAFEAACGQVLP
jgi:GNAT superfamily N-acetyltransferase